MVGEAKDSEPQPTQQAKKNVRGYAHKKNGNRQKFMHTTATPEGLTLIAA
jgi:hypothetical protein